MANKMLIDSSHPEETRVVVLRGNRVEEFDFESASKKQLRGNIYLAKVTRVEPSLQAAFVEYGGNRHGFLAFSEIHPDYYQIPVADRLALLEEEARTHTDEEEEEAKPQRRTRRNRRNGRERFEKRSARSDESVTEEIAEVEGGAGAPRAENSSEPRDNDDDSASTPYARGEETISADEPPTRIGEISVADQRFERPPDEIVAYTPTSETPTISEDQPPSPIGEIAVMEQRFDEAAPTFRDHSDAAPPAQDESLAAPSSAEPVTSLEKDEERAPAAEDAVARQESAEDDDDEEDDDEEEEEQVEQIGGDALEEMPNRTHRLRRQYKIQEVIKRRQVLLVQVVKEERGNKGAALTTYLSLAGRYSVLMPNTARGGGISRKITDAEDRKRLKAIAQDLEVPEGMGVILRTAGAARTKQEVRRDFEYLLRMWETVREVTLKSSAPMLVYEEGSLIKRAIRDLYNKDIEEILVAGEEGFREAHDFMRMLMPTHVKSIVSYRDPQPVFARHGVEAQLDSMFSNQVTLRSGGYLVINQTEALVAIDVNSGRSTREHNIEDTALRTNLEAADEVARQLRLRDLAGLIVVDFIDMEENRNNRAVERRIKEALKNDRARIQVGRISHFGLLEMSRQRIRTGVLEGSTIVCPHCAGSGAVRSTASIALHVLRVLEDALIKSAAFNVTLRARTSVALYILNQKRLHLRELEERFGVTVTVAADDALTGSSYHTIERGEPSAPIVRPERRQESVRIDSLPPAEIEDEDEDVAIEEETDETETDGAESEAEASARGESASPDDAEGQRRRRRKRRRRGRGADREASGIQAEAPQPSDEALSAMAGMAGSGGFASAGFSAISDGEVDEGEAAVEGEAAETATETTRTPRRRRSRGRSRTSDDRRVEAGAQDEATNAPSVEPPMEDGYAGRGAEPIVSTAASPDKKSDHPAPWAEPETKPETKPAAPETKPAALETKPAAPAPIVLAPPPSPLPVVELPEAQPPGEKRSGWWQRAKATFGGA